MPNLWVHYGFLPHGFNYRIGLTIGVPPLFTPGRRNAGCCINIAGEGGRAHNIGSGERRGHQHKPRGGRRRH